jgi:CHAD domain-containing protein
MISTPAPVAPPVPAAQQPDQPATESPEARLPEDFSHARKSLTLQEFIASAPELKRPGVDPDDSLAEAGRKVLRFHFAQMLLHESGTLLGEDIEELHDMRVATRRMRAAFEVFEGAFTPKFLKAHLKGLRLTGRALGSVRDMDVFMEKARNYARTLPEEHQADLEPLLDAWQQDREDARTSMVDYLHSDKYNTFKEKFYGFVNTPGAGSKFAAGSKLAAGSQPLPSRVREVLPVLIYTRLASVRAFDSILERASLEQLHALRIEFKKLRYTLEFFREVLGAEAKTIIEEIKKLQDHLGDLNDAQVATQRLREFLAKWEEQQASLPVSQRQAPAPVLAYLLYSYQELHTLMSTFPQAWEHFNRPELGQNISQAVAVL